MGPMTATLLSADEYIATGDTRSRWTELINGEVIENNPTIGHQEVVGHIHVELRIWMRAKPGRGRSPAQLDVRFDHDNVLAPDVLWVSEGRMPADGTHLDFAPELVVEVRSPSNWRYDTTVKFRVYESAGVAEVWLVDTAANTVLVYRRSTPSSPTFDVALELAVGEHSLHQCSKTSRSISPNSSIANAVRNAADQAWTKRCGLPTKRWR
jgi:Uma2 family endonuclease